VRFHNYVEINLDHCTPGGWRFARDGIMGWSLPLPNAVGGHVHANGLLQFTAAANADAATALSANYGTATSEVVVSAAHQLRTILSVFEPLANGTDGHTQSASTVVGGAVVDIISSTLRKVDAFSAAAVDAADFAKRTRAVAAGYCDDIAGDLIAGDTDSGKVFSVAPGDEHTLVQARAVVSQMGPYLEQLCAQRDASPTDFTKAVTEGSVTTATVATTAVTATSVTSDPCDEIGYVPLVCCVIFLVGNRHLPLSKTERNIRYRADRCISFGKIVEIPNDRVLHRVQIGEPVL